MESVCIKHAVSSSNHNTLLHKKSKRQALPPTRIRRRNFPLHNHKGFRPHVIKSYKQSDFQDFQSYAKPKQLLVATEPKVCTEASDENVLTSFSVDRSLFKVELQTSKVYDSGVSDLDAGILLCLIDETGDSILQRIPVILKSDSAESTEMVELDALHFQRGSIDEFSFEGPKLGRIEALWISVESGQWRLGGVNLTVISSCEPSSGESDGENIEYTALQYEFEVNDVLLGQGSNVSMIELRPCLVSKLSQVDPLAILSKSTSQSTSLPNSGMSNEESMSEYADLKLSLLTYDAILILVGSTILRFSAGENPAFAFLVGGIGGFLYLLLLERAVDELPASSLNSRNTSRINQLFGGYKGPLSSVALAVGLTFLALKYNSADVPSVLTPKELLVGMMGFLACKVAVVLAAFKPMALGLKDEE